MLTVIWTVMFADGSLNSPRQNNGNAGNGKKNQTKTNKQKTPNKGYISISELNTW